MPPTSRRMRREAATVEAMIHRYCHDLHGTTGLCPECATLLEYARRRLEKCPFQEGKTTCGKCRVHCYRREMRERIMAVMRHAGPRMLFSHPLLALMHAMDGLRSEPRTRKDKGKG